MRVKLKQYTGKDKPLYLLTVEGGKWYICPQCRAMYHMVKKECTDYCVECAGELNNKGVV